MTNEQLAQMAAIIAAQKIWDSAEQYKQGVIEESVRVARAIWAEMNKPKQIPTFEGNKE